MNDILELVPCVPKLYKLDMLLKDKTYDENQATMDIDSQVSVRSYMVCPTREADALQGTGLTYERAKKEIQASDGELERALKDRRILIIDG